MQNIFSAIIIAVRNIPQVITNIKKLNVENKICYACTFSSALYVIVYIKPTTNNVHYVLLT